MKKKLTALLLTLCLALSLLPVRAHAGWAEDAAAAFPGVKFDWSHNVNNGSGYYDADESGNYYLFGSTVWGNTIGEMSVYPRRIKVSGASTVANLYFDNATIDLALHKYGGTAPNLYFSPIEIQDGATVNIYINGTCTFKGEKYCAAIHKDSINGALNIYVKDGSKLIALGGAGAAGIGGNYSENDLNESHKHGDSNGVNAYNIHIKSMDGWYGTVEAIGGQNGAGIGSGAEFTRSSGSAPMCNNVTVEGGEVYAAGVEGGAAIGGGCGGGGTDISIIRGNVTLALRSEYGKEAAVSSTQLIGKGNGSDSSRNNLIRVPNEYKGSFTIKRGSPEKPVTDTGRLYANENAPLELSGSNGVYRIEIRTERCYHPSLSDWQNDNTNHWKICLDCHVHRDEAAHRFDDSGWNPETHQNLCAVCKNVYIEDTTNPMIVSRISGESVIGLSDNGELYCDVGKTSGTVRIFDAASGIDADNGVVVQGARMPVTKDGNFYNVTLAFNNQRYGIRVTDRAGNSRVYSNIGLYRSYSLSGKLDGKPIDIQKKYDDGTTEIVSSIGYKQSFSFSLVHQKDKYYTATVNGAQISMEEDGKFHIREVTGDVQIAITLNADTVKPTGSLSLSGEGAPIWTEKGGPTDTYYSTTARSVTITGADKNDNGVATEGVKSYYYLSTSPLSDTQLDALGESDWTEYTAAFDISPDRDCIIYVKLADLAGNVTYIRSSMLVLDATAPSISGIADKGVYYGETSFTVSDAHLKSVTDNGKLITAAGGSYKITPDNKSHIVTAEDIAGNKTSYTVEIYKIYTVSFMVDGKLLVDKYVNHGFDLTDIPDIPTKPGYDWIKPVWDVTDFSKITSDMVVNAKYTLNFYGINLYFDSRGGSEIPKVFDNISSVIGLEKYKPTREGFAFSGWHRDPFMKQPVKEIQLERDTTIFAKWVYQGEGSPFKDVAKDSYYYNAVVWALERNITDGKLPQIFEPDTSCTRAQAVSFLWRAMGCPETKNKENPFTDVKPDAYYYKAVLWAIGEGITDGTTPTTFSPEDTVTRAQSVTFLWRKMGKPETAGANPFEDVRKEDYYYNAVLWAVEKTITDGVTPTTFVPEQGCSRAQSVTFLNRCFG